MAENPEPSVHKPKWPWLLSAFALVLLVLGGWWIYDRYDGMPGKDPRLESLIPPAFSPLPLGEVKPQGWLLDQLKLQASGLTGHLDEFWPDVKDSGWIGGKAEGWERAPYWLDGLVPMAYLIDDARLKAKVKHWIDYILTHQTPDGWLGPQVGRPATGTHDAPLNAPRDPWPEFIILKVLAQYQEATHDPRVLPAMERSARNIDVQMDQRHLFSWNYFRWGDYVMTLYWLYDRTKEPWLLDAAVKAANQGYDWTHHFWDLPVKTKSEGWTWGGHVVNNAMGLKVPALLYRLTGDERYKKLAWRAIVQLDRYHGEPDELFSGDECLAGLNPSQGTELCAIVETMFSLENDLSITGDVRFADRLEKIAYNALPAACTPDYWQHQYVEQSNQVISAFINHPIYATVSGGGNLFGLEPHYGCCTANMHQGWPKLVSHLWMASPDGGLAAVVYAPSVVRTQVGGVPVTIEEVTDYPFSDTIAFRVTVPQAVTFPIYFRIPLWTKDASIQLPEANEGSLAPGGFYKLNRQWNGTQTVTLHLPMPFHIHKWYQDSISVERGPLIYSLGIKTHWLNFEPFPYEPKGNKKYDLSVEPESPWNYALAIDPEHLDKSFQVTQKTLRGNPFEPGNEPLDVSVQGKLLPDWQASQGAAAPPPQSPVQSMAPLEKLTLVPYGSTRLRITAFPVLK